MIGAELEENFRSHPLELRNEYGYQLGRLLYNAYIHSHLVHCATYWGMACEGKLRKLHRMQK